MKEKGEYTKKKQKGATDTTESEPEVEEDPLGLVQPSDQQDDDYRPSQPSQERENRRPPKQCKMGGTNLQANWLSG